MNYTYDDSKDTLTFRFENCAELEVQFYDNGAGSIAARLPATDANWHYGRRDIPELIEAIEFVGEILDELNGTGDFAPEQEGEQLSFDDFDQDAEFMRSRWGGEAGGIRGAVLGTSVFLPRISGRDVERCPDCDPFRGCCADG